YYPQALNAEGTACSSWMFRSIGYPFALAYFQGIFAVMSGDYSTKHYTAYSVDGGISWKRGTVIETSSAGNLRMMSSGSGGFLIIGNSGVAYSNNGNTWEYSSSSGIASNCVENDSFWDEKGKRFIVFSGKGCGLMGLWSTDRPDGLSKWKQINTTNYHIVSTNGEQFKYGGGYYVRKTISGDKTRSSDDLSSGNYKEGFPNISRKGALNYGPGFWAILTQYGDIMCSTDSSATQWNIVDGSSSNTTSSSLYRLSNKEDWVGLCYGDYDGGRWVAYTKSGDVAVLKGKGIEPTTGRYTKQGSIKLLNVGDDDEYWMEEDSMTISVNEEQINSQDSDGRYYVEFDMEGITINSITYQPSAKYMSTVAALNAQIVDWGAKIVQTPTYVSLTGTYDNYNETDLFHRLNYNSCTPTLAHTGFASDISLIFDAYVGSISGTITMPEYSYNTWFSGKSRLFSQRIRESANDYCQLSLDSSTYDDKANLLAHVFSMPYNSVLYFNGYQSNGHTANEAVSQVTKDACAKLKSDYGDDLRIYIIKYRKQEKYKTFPFHGTTQVDLSHNYDYLDSCASGTSAPYLYDVSTKAELEDALTAIAKDIKENFAGYTDAKAFNVEQ
nr:hypothetical protein [Alphaproteobacteria bacterium]